MTYPSAPWRLEGYGIQSLHLVDIQKAISFVPSELEIVSIWPGKTLGGIYVSTYKGDSILKYNELIVVPAIVRYENNIGAWISHIYVDNEDSVKGGREIWGLPKEMAKFTWDNQGKVTIRQNQRELCHLSYSKSLFNLSTPWKLQLTGNVFGGLGSELRYFQGLFKSHIGLLNAKLQIPQDSPFAALNLNQPWLSLELQNLELVADVPKLLGNKIINLSYR